jgi:hypothetical protein
LQHKGQRAGELLERVREVAEFLLGPLSDDQGRLYRTFRGGRAKNTGFLEDYADVGHGLLELHVATGELRWLAEASRLARLAVELFGDEEHGGFFRTPEHGELLIARQKAFDDNPTPSGNSMLAHVLLRLARIYGDDELERRAVGVFRLIAHALARAPQAFGHDLAAELIGRVRSSNLAAYAHAELPFERLVEVLNPARSLARHPLFQVMLAFQNNAEVSLDLPGLSTSLEPIATAIAKFDLSVSIGEQRTPDGSPAGLSGVVEYATDLFDRASVEALAARLVRVLEGAVAAPDAAVDDVDLRVADLEPPGAVRVGAVEHSQRRSMRRIGWRWRRDRSC